MRAVTIYFGESRKLRATSLKVLERTLDEIARNGQITSGGEKVFRGLQPEQLYAMCSKVGAGGSHHDVGVEPVVVSLAVHTHLSRFALCLTFCSDRLVGI